MSERIAQAWVMALTARIARFFYPYGEVRQVLRGPIRGTRFIVGPGMGVTYALGAEGLTPSMFERHVRRGMTVFDVGANRGQMALYLARLVGAEGRVVAFEPVPEIYETLEQNLAINNLTWVRPLMVAASDAGGTLRFLYHPEHPTQGKLAHEEPTYVVAGSTESNVTAVTLDSLLSDEPPPDMIKIDVEGAGAAVLRGAADIIQRFSPAIYIDLHGPEEQAGVRDSLLAKGYVAENMRGERVRDLSLKWESPLWCHRP